MHTATVTRINRLGESTDTPPFHFNVPAIQARGQPRGKVEPFQEARLRAGIRGSQARQAPGSKGCCLALRSGDPGFSPCHRQAARAQSLTSRCVFSRFYKALSLSVSLRGVSCYKRRHWSSCCPVPRPRHYQHRPRARATRRLAHALRCAVSVLPGTQKPQLLALLRHSLSS